MRHYLKLFVYGNFWIGLCALAQGLLTYRLIDMPYSLPLVIVLFLAATFVYNIGVLIDFRSIKQHQYESVHMQFVSKHALSIVLLSVFSLGLIFPIAFLTLKWNTIILLAITACLALVYSLPILPRGKGGLRQIAGVKIFLIAGVWSLSVVAVPLVESGIELASSQIVLLMLRSFVLVFVLALVADIRDEVSDRKNSLHTFATYLGLKTARYLCFALLFVELLLMYSYAWNKAVFVGFVLFTLVACWVIGYAFRKQSSLYNLLAADGLTIAQLIIVEVTLYFITNSNQ